MLGRRWARPLTLLLLELIPFIVRAQQRVDIVEQRGGLRVVLGMRLRIILLVKRHGSGQSSLRCRGGGNRRRYALLLWRLCLMMLSYSVYEKKEKTKTKKIFIVYNPIMTQYEYTEFRSFKRVWFYWFF